MFTVTIMQSCNERPAFIFKIGNNKYINLNALCTQMGNLRFGRNDVYYYCPIALLTKQQAHISDHWRGAKMHCLPFSSRNTSLGKQGKQPLFLEAGVKTGRGHTSISIARLFICPKEKGWTTTPLLVLCIALLFLKKNCIISVLSVFVVSGAAADTATHIKLHTGIKKRNSLLLPYVHPDEYKDKILADTMLVRSMATVWYFESWSYSQ